MSDLYCTDPNCTEEHEDDRCPECGETLGHGHKPYRGLICETCAQHQKDMAVERYIDEYKEGEHGDIFKKTKAD